MLWVKVLFYIKNADFLQKYADISKSKRVLLLKGIFFEATYVFVLKYQIWRVILKSFRQGRNYTNSLQRKKNLQKAQPD